MSENIDSTTVRVQPTTKKLLDEIKEENETYDDAVGLLLEFAEQ
jgi:hypothetical protein